MWDGCSARDLVLVACQNVHVPLQDLQGLVVELDSVGIGVDVDVCACRLEVRVVDAPHAGIVGLPEESISSRGRTVDSAESTPGDPHVACSARSGEAEPRDALVIVDDSLVPVDRCKSAPLRLLIDDVDSAFADVGTREGFTEPVTLVGCAQLAAEDGLRDDRPGGLHGGVQPVVPSRRVDVGHHLVMFGDFRGGRRRTGICSPRVVVSIPASCECRDEHGCEDA